MRDEGSIGRSRRALALVATLVAGGLLAVPSAAPAATYEDAALLVSGFDTASPFTSPDPSCDGKEGPEWSLQGGIAPTLKAAGLKVFTAPVQQAGEALPAPCSGTGEPTPPSSTTINSNGETDVNGAALAGLIGFLRDSYGVRRLQIVGHSDGGLWSRSAITQDDAYAGVDVLSLTTLGTPHTGSLVADLAIQLDGGKCNFSNSIEQLICSGVVEVAQLMLKDLGKVATTELTNGFLTPWNKQQRIGSCPVTGIAGNHVTFYLPALGYYTPNDGAVGVGSALGQKALALDGSTIPAPGIPNFHQGGTYDVVHSDTLSFISARSLLNTQAISDKVRDTVVANASGTVACNTGAGETDPGTVRLGLPLYRFQAPNRRGLLPRPDDGDYVAALGGVGIRCGADELIPTAHRGDRRIHLFGSHDCDKRLRVTAREAGVGVAGASGKARRRGEALLLDRARRNSVRIRVEGRKARIRVRGAKVRGLRAVAWSGGKRHRLDLDRRGRTALPRGSKRTWLRIRARTKPGWAVSTAQATLPG